MRLLRKASLIYLPRDSVTSFCSNIFHQKSRKAPPESTLNNSWWAIYFCNNLCLDSRCHYHVEAKSEALPRKSYQSVLFPSKNHFQSDFFSYTTVGAAIKLALFYGYSPVSAFRSTLFSGGNNNNNCFRRFKGIILGFHLFVASKKGKSWNNHKVFTFPPSFPWLCGEIKFAFLFRWCESSGVVSFRPLQRHVPSFIAFCV